MSLSREMVASIFGVSVDEVKCQKCGYGDGGELLGYGEGGELDVRCINPFYGDVIVDGGGYCPFWVPESDEEWVY